MRWLEISLQVDGEAAEAVSECFDRYGQGGAVIERVLLSDDSYATLTVKTFLPVDGSQETRRRQLEEAIWHLSQLYPMPPLQVRELAEEDWAEAWKKHYHAQHVGQHLTIVPSWQRYAPQEGEIVIRMEPGMAFGTGSHPTTRMCLIELERHVEPGMRVLDVGTGSGILAIAAAKLGANFVLALDAAPVAVREARENVTANRVGHIVHVELGTIEVMGYGSGVKSSDELSRNPYPLTPHLFDLIVVNILAEVIIAMAEKLALLLKPGGLLLLAGIIEDKEPQVQTKLQTLGLRVIGRGQEKDWVTLVGRREEALDIVR